MGLTPAEAANKAARAKLAKLKHSSSPKDFWETEIVSEINRDIEVGNNFCCVINLERELRDQLVAYGESLGWVCDTYNETTLFVYWGKMAERHLSFRKMELVFKTACLFLVGCFSCWVLWALWALMGRA